MTDLTAPTTADDWADLFGNLRTSGATAPSAWLGIPLVIVCLLGMLWSLPVPEALGRGSPIVNGATLWVMTSFVYYCILSIRLALAGLVFLIAATIPGAWLELAGLPLWPLASSVFVPAFAWQLVETRRATGRLRIARNLQYLMLGPVWLIRAAYHRLGIDY